MIKLTPSTTDDIEQIQEWISLDQLSRPSTPEWWLTGANGSLLIFCLTDDKGPLCFVRLDRDGELVRFHMLFGPVSEVSKIRLIKGILKAIPIVMNHAKDIGAKGAVFDSRSPSLIAFMERQGFIFDKGEDYILKFCEVS